MESTPVRLPGGWYAGRGGRDEAPGPSAEPPGGGEPRRRDRFGFEVGWETVSLLPRSERTLGRRGAVACLSENLGPASEERPLSVSSRCGAVSADAGGRKTEIAPRAE